MKNLGAILAPPLLCVGLLAGIALQQRTPVPPDAPVVLAYHERARGEINALPRMITIDGVQWAAEARKPETAAVRLLKPNIILSRHYVEAVLDRFPRSVDLLIVQCRDSRDMVGHYPPICYRNIGYQMLEKKAPEPLQVGSVSVPYTEYFFEKWTHGQAQQLCIYNFFVMPGRGAVADIDGVDRAAADYERRFFGAAQFQVLIPVSQVPRRHDREKIFAGLVRSRPELIENLISDGLSQ